MVVPTLAVSALFAIVSAAVYVYVGLELRKRDVTGDGRLAWQLFVLWWLALGGITLVGAVQSLAGAAGVADLAIAVTFTYVALLVLCIALWGLVYYLGYLFTGKRSLLLPLTIFYGAVYALLVYFIVVQDPTSVAVGRWSVTLNYAQTVGGAFYAVIIGAILLPELLAGIAYGTLYFKVKDRSQRYRIALVSVSTVVWFGSALVASAAGASQSDAWQVASKAIALVASLTILAAYRPPGFVRRRGIVGVTENSGGGAAPEPATAMAPGPRRGSSPADLASDLPV